MDKVRNFIYDVRKEISKVHFPSKKEMVMYSVATIGFIFILSAFFFLSDLVIAFFKLLVRS
jgi:preprotein translocase subunit SecE